MGGQSTFMIGERKIAALLKKSQVKLLIYLQKKSGMKNYYSHAPSICYALHRHNMDLTLGHFRNEKCFMFPFQCTKKSQDHPLNKWKKSKVEFHFRRKTIILVNSKFIHLMLRRI